MHLLAQCGDEGIAPGGRQQHVIGGDAGLPAVEPLAGGDARGSLLDRVIVGDQHRRLAAQFQRQRGQVGGGGGHHLAPDRGRAGEHQVVERQRRECRADLGTAGGNRDPIRREHLRQQAAQELGGARGVFGRLQVHVVAGGDRGGQRDQRQIDRVVPRRDHAHHAQRHRPDLRACRQQPPAHADPLRAHPAAQVLAQVVDAVEHGHAIGDPRFVHRTVAEIGGNRRGHLVHPPLQRGAQALQVVAALPEIRRGGLPAGAQALQGGGEIGDGGVRGDVGESIHAPECSPGFWRRGSRMAA